MSSRIDDQVGQSSIADDFASIYSTLYNKVELDDKFNLFRHEIDESVDETGQAQLNRINPSLIRKVIGQMKTNKYDAMFDIQSDCVINGPPELQVHTCITSLNLLFAMVLSQILL